MMTSIFVNFFISSSLLEMKYLAHLWLILFVALLPVLPANAALKANYVIDGSNIRDMVTRTSFAIQGNKAMAISSYDGSSKAWRTDGYTTFSSAKNINTIKEDLTAELIFAIDTHAIVKHDDANANNYKVAVASCLSDTYKSGFGFYLGRTGKYSCKVYVAGQLVELEGTGTIPLWQWNSLCLTVKDRDIAGNEVKLYLNGTEVASTTVAADGGVLVWGSTDENIEDPNKANFPIGRDVNYNDDWCGARTADFNGAIASIKLWDEVIVPSFSAKYADLNLPADRYDGDRLRARYHGQPGMNWTNETHGLYYNPADQKYHVFFQRTGSAPVMTHAHWGHIVSSDLVNWKDDKPVLNPSESYDLRGCWSGCVFTDSKFNNGNPTIIYSGVGYGGGESYANMAFCDDQTNLRQWSKKGALVGPYNNTARDPFFFRTDENNAYFMIGYDNSVKLYRYNGSGWDDKGSFYDLQSGEGNFPEMPCVVKLPNNKWLMAVTPQGMAGGVKCIYRIGDISSEGKFVNYGESAPFDIFATDGFGLMSPSFGKDKDGNIIALGIVADKMSTQFNLDHGYAHLYSLPRQIGVDAQGRLTQKPCSSATAMRGSVSKVLSEQTINGTLNLNPVRGRQAEICATFVVGNNEFGFNFYKDKLGKTAFVKYNPADHTISVNFDQIAKVENILSNFSYQLPVYPAVGETMKLQLFIDHSIIDLFVNDRYAASVRVFPADDNADLIEVFSNGETKLKSLEAYLLGEGDCSEYPVEPFDPSSVIELPATSGKIAFIKSAISVSEQENAALTFFQNGYDSETVLTTSDAQSIKAANFDCIWIHIDRKGLARGAENLPSEFIASDLISALKQYVADGGNLLLTGHATQMVVSLDRVDQKYAPNVFGSGDGGAGSDEWLVNTNFAGQDNSSHKIFNALDGASPKFGLLYGGGSAITREDHNCMWASQSITTSANSGNSVENFEADTNSGALGTWGQVEGAAEFGIVEFYPAGASDGTILCNGLAACQWYVKDGVNYDYQNLQRLTGNMIAYLASATGEEPYRPNPGTGGDPGVEVEETTGKIALYLAYADVNDLNASNNRDEKAAYDFFLSTFPAETYPDAKVLFNTTEDVNKMTVENFDCIWIYIEREGVTVTDGNINLGSWVSDQMLTNLKQFKAKGGNIYLCKYANQLVHNMDLSKPAPNEVGTGTGANISDSWRADIEQNGCDWSTHPIFQGIPTVEIEGYTMIELLTGSNWRMDHNVMWNMTTFGGHSSFTSDYNADVLATWGHNTGDATNFAGIVEFKPTSSESNRAISQDKVDARKGTVIANGLAAYEWSLKEGTNQSLDNVKTLSKNILVYLSPKAEQSLPTCIDGVVDNNAGKVYLNQNTLYYSGFSSDAIISVYSVDGKSLARFSASEDGCFTLYNKGVLIINVTDGNNSSSYKFNIR